MPKAKADQVITFRVELQGRERELAEQYLAVYGLGRVGEVAKGFGVPELVKMMDDPTKVVQVLYSMATIYEAIFGYDSTRWPTVFDAGNWWDEYQAKSNKMNADREECGGSVTVWGQLLDTLRVFMGADEDVLRSRWDCPDEETETATTDSNSETTQDEQDWPGGPGSGGGGGRPGGGGPFGSPI